MISSSFDISEFIKNVKGRCDQEIVYLADQEATAAERYLCKHARNQRQTGTSDDCADVRYYVVLLKDFILYIRYGILTQSVRQLGMTLPDSFGEPC